MPGDSYSGTYEDYVAEADEKGLPDFARLTQDQWEHNAGIERDQNEQEHESGQRAVDDDRQRIRENREPRATTGADDQSGWSLLKRDVWNRVHGTTTQAERARERVEGEIAQLDASRSTPEQLMIGDDDESLNAQRQALGRLQQMGSGRYNAEDRARQQMMQQQNAIQEQSQRMAVMQQAQARGMGRSGTQLAGALGAQQAGANRNAQQGLGLEAMAQQRALQSLQMQGGMATNMRQQGNNVRMFNSQARDRAFGQNERTRALSLGQYGGAQDQKGFWDNVEDGIGGAAGLVGL